MTATERRASASLASIFALRMLGLFLVLPVFALEARRYPGGEDPMWLGLAMGIYGLTQGLLQLPFGMASDRFGRKRVIVLGLLIFALGSFWAAAATDLMGLLVGRSLQGAGAVSAAVTALLADLTRDEVRTKAMAMVGGSIGLMFALSLVVSPLLAGWIGLSGLFGLTGVLALVGVGVVIWSVPAAPAPVTGEERGRLRDVLAHADLMRLNVGVFVLHAVQLAMWVSVPALLVQAGLQTPQHWQVYLPAVALSFVFLGLVFAAERRGHLKKVFLLSILFDGRGGTWFAGAVGRYPEPGLDGGVVVGVFLWFQRLGGDPAQSGLAHGATGHAGHRHGGLQHAAVAGVFCGGAGWRLAGQVLGQPDAVFVLCWGHVGLAVRGFAHANAWPWAAHWPGGLRALAGCCTLRQGSGLAP
jgi:MFS family permease